jgi:hypothetical protein
MELISLIDAGEPELNGAEHRLAIAIQALEDFRAEFGRKAISSELADSVQNETCSKRN